MNGFNQRVEFIIGSYWRRMETCDVCDRPVEVHTGVPPSMKPFFQYTCVPCGLEQFHKAAVEENSRWTIK